MTKFAYFLGSEQWQPEELIDHAKLSKSIETPICLDESINGVERAIQAV